jgi:hypothetical protein
MTEANPNKGVLEVDDEPETVRARCVERGQANCSGGHAA